MLLIYIIRREILSLVDLLPEEEKSLREHCVKIEKKLKRYRDTAHQFNVDIEEVRSCLEDAATELESVVNAFILGNRGIIKRIDRLSSLIDRFAGNKNE